MKEFLLLLMVLILASNASHPVEVEALKSEQQGLVATQYLLDGISQVNANTASGSLKAKEEEANEGLRGVKRVSRDVASLVDAKGSLESVGVEGNNVDFRDVVDLLKPEAVNLPVEKHVEPSTQNNIQQCQVQSQRSVRDVLHMPQTITNLSLLKGVLNCLTTITEEELEKSKKSKNLGIVHHTPQEVAREIIKHAELQDHLQRDEDIPEKNVERGDKLNRQVRDVTHFIRIHSTQLEQPKDLKGGDGENLERTRRDLTQVPEIQSTEAPQSKEQLNGKVDQNQLTDQLIRQTRETPQPKYVKIVDEDNLERKRRDVTHVLEIQSTEAPQSEGQLKVKVDQNQLADKLNRQASDVVHWLGAHTTQAPQPNDQARDDIDKMERKIRDVSHLLETHTIEASQTKDLLIAEEIQNQSADKLSLQPREVPQPKDRVKEDAGNLERTRRDVAHVFDIQSTEAPQSEGQLEVKVDQNQLTDKLNRQARDVVHWLGAHTTQVPEPNDQVRQDVDKQERKIRDVSHLLETNATEAPPSEDLLKAEVNQAQIAGTLKRQARDVVPLLGKQPTQAPQLYDQEREDLDKLKRPTRDVSHLLQNHARDGPLSEDLLKPEEKQAQIAGTFGIYTTEATKLDDQEREDVDKVKRPIRDVSHLLQTQNTEAPQSKDLLPAEEAQSQSADKLRVVQPLFAIFTTEAPQPYDREREDVDQLKRPIRYVSDLLETRQKEDLLPTEESQYQYAEKVNRQVRESPLLGIHTTETPQPYRREREDFDKGERTIRDVSHLLGTQTSEAPLSAVAVKDYRVPEPVTDNLRQVVHSNEKLQTGPTILPSNSEQDSRKDEDLVADNPQRPARDVSHLFGIHSTEIPQSQDLAKREETAPQADSNKDNSKRQVRDVKHLFRSPTTAGSQFNANLPIKDTVQPKKSEHQFDEVVGQLTRPTRDIKHLIESQTTEATQIEIVTALNANQVINNLERQTRDVAHLLQSKGQLEEKSKKIEQDLLQNPKPVKQQSDAKRDSGKRYSRDIYHLLRSHTTSNVPTKEEVTAENSDSVLIPPEERLKRNTEEDPVASSLPENNIQDVLQRTQRSLEVATGSPATFSDQIVEDDQYIESISKQQVAREEDPPSFHQKAKRSNSIKSHSEINEEIPNQIVQEIPTPEIERVTRSSLTSITEELKRLRRSSVVPINDAGKIQRCDHLKSQAVHIADVPSKRVQRSSEVQPEESSAEVSTQITQSEEKTTTPNPDSLVLLKPTVKVQPARLPLTVYAAKRNNIVKVPKRLPDVAFTEKPKVNKRRF